MIRASMAAIDELTGTKVGLAWAPIKPALARTLDHDVDSTRVGGQPFAIRLPRGCKPPDPLLEDSLLMIEGQAYEVIESPRGGHQRARCDGDAAAMRDLRELC
jgi:hypothetical protein